MTKSHQYIAELIRSQFNYTSSENYRATRTACIDYDRIRLKTGEYWGSEFEYIQLLKNNEKGNRQVISILMAVRIDMIELKDSIFKHPSDEYLNYVNVYDLLCDRIYLCMTHKENLSLSDTLKLWKEYDAIKAIIESHRNFHDCIRVFS